VAGLPEAERFSEKLTRNCGLVITRRQSDFTCAVSIIGMKCRSQHWVLHYVVFIGAMLLELSIAL
jgi:hypothetical protein